MVVEQSGMASLDTPVIGTEEYGTTRQSRYSGGAESGMAHMHRWYGTARYTWYGTECWKARECERYSRVAQLVWHR